MLILSLNSSKVKVKQAGIEALAVVNNNLSESQTSAILDPVLNSNCDPDTVKMLQRRFLSLLFLFLFFPFSHIVLFLIIILNMY